MMTSRYKYRTDTRVMNIPPPIFSDIIKNGHKLLMIFVWKIISLVRFILPADCFPLHSFSLAGHQMKFSFYIRKYKDMCGSSQNVICMYVMSRRRLIIIELVYGVDYRFRAFYFLINSKS